MDEREAFIEAIAAGPDDDTPRLAFADWLDEHGEERRAELIRLTCRIARAGEGEVPRPDADRARELVEQHWPDWLRPLFRAVGMPEPGPAVPPPEPGGIWRYGPYRLDLSEWCFLPNTLFTRYSDGAAGLPPPFLNLLTFDRGMVTGLDATLGRRTPGCSLGAALGLEPIASLALTLDPDPRHWHALTHHRLRRVRELTLTLAAAGHDHADALGAVLDDPALAGVGSLMFCGEDHTDPEESFNGGPSSYHAPPATVARLLRTAVADRVGELRLRVGPDGIRALADAPPLDGLRSLDLTWNDLGPGHADLFARLPYRDRLRHLRIFDERAGPAVLPALAAGPAWVSLAELEVVGTGARPELYEALARSNALPALRRLSLSECHLGDGGAAALARGPLLRQLTHLNLSDCWFGDVGALAVAGAVEPSVIEELGLGMNELSDPARRRIRNRLLWKVAFE